MYVRFSVTNILHAMHAANMSQDRTSTNSYSNYSKDCSFLFITVLVKIIVLFGQFDLQMKNISARFKTFP